MKQAKKLFAILLVGLSVLAVGCGSSDSTAQSPAASTETSDSTATDNADTTTTESPAADAASESTSASPTA